MLWADLIRPKETYSSRRYKAGGEFSYRGQKEDLKEAGFILGEKTICDNGETFTTLHEADSIGGVYAFIGEDSIIIDGKNEMIGGVKGLLEKLFKTKLTEVENQDEQRN